MKERDNKTIFTSGRYRPLPQEWLRDPAWGFLDIFLKGRPNKTPGSAIAVPGSPRTWRPDAGFSIKNQFKLLN
jgi:hypothetical protein